jgi:hypothetical protein
LLLAQGQIERAQALVESLPATWRWLQWAGDLAAQAGNHRRATERYASALDLLDRQFDTTAPGSAAAIKALSLLAPSVSASRATSNGPGPITAQPKRSSRTTQ